jgi:DNA-binding transcriptional ArsR family regulator
MLRSSRRVATGFRELPVRVGLGRDARGGENNPAPARSSREAESVPKKDPLQPQRCAELLAALAAPERLKIVRFLADGPHNVTEIVEMLAIKAVNVSHHLTVLKHAGLIAGKKKGRFVLYSLRPGVLEEAVDAGVPAEALNLGCCRIELPLGGAGAVADNTC